MKDEQKQILTPDDLAERWGIPKQTIYVWRTKGKGPRAMTIGRHLRYRLTDVLAWEETTLDQEDNR